jgi:hypothetical protein
MMTAPEPSPELFIRSPRWKLLLALLLPLTLTACLVVLSQPARLRKAPPQVAWLFGFAWLALLTFCVLAPRYCYLHLTAEGFTVHDLRRSRFYPWSQVRNFRVHRLSVNNVPMPATIVFDYTADAPRDSLFEEVLSDIAGFNDSLAGTYEISAKELAELLGAWQRKYGSAQAESRQG